MLSQQVFELVDGSRTKPPQTLPQRRDLPIFGVARTGRLHSPNALHRLARQPALPIHPEDLPQGVGIAAIGLLPRLSLWLDEDHLAAAVLRQQLQQPIVETADLHDRHNPSFRCTRFPQFFQKTPHPRPFRTDLTFQYNIPRFVAKIHGQLLAMLVDGKVQHTWSSCLWF